MNLPFVLQSWVVADLAPLWVWLWMSQKKMMQNMNRMDLHSWLITVCWILVEQSRLILWTPG